MTADELKQSLTFRPHVPTIIWGAMTLAVPIYLVIGLLVTQHNQPNSFSGLRFFQIALAAFSVVQAIAAVVVRWFTFGDSSSANDWHAFQTDSARDYSDADKGAADAHVQQIQTRLIISFALTESIGIYGLLLVFLTMDVQHVYPFAAAAFVLMLLQYPSPGRIWKSVLRKLEEQSSGVA